VLAILYTVIIVPLRIGFNSFPDPDHWAFWLVRKTPLFAPFVYKNDHFTKTGSGQT
jgi:hypothetical protein